MRPALLLALALAASPAAAHSPVISTDAKTAEAPWVIDEPEHSKAIFAMLDGDPDYYRITSDRPFRFYAGITAAKVEGCPLRQSFSFDVYDAAGKRVDGRKGGDPASWTPWYEEWGKTWYWVGPEIGKDFKATAEWPAGSYTIKVWNKGNTGRYVLAVGDEERFGLGTLVTIGRTMKEVKAGWWGEGSGICPG